MLLFIDISGEYFLFGQIVSDIGEAVERWLLVDEYLMIELKLLLGVEQSDRDEISTVCFEQIEEMAAAPGTESPSRPFRGFVQSDVFFPVKPHIGSAVYRHQWSTSPPTTHAAMTGPDLGVHGRDGYPDRAAQTLTSTKSLLIHSPPLIFLNYRTPELGNACRALNY